MRLTDLINKLAELRYQHGGDTEVVDIDGEALLLVAYDELSEPPAIVFNFEDD